MPRHRLYIGLAALATLPGIYFRLGHVHLSPPLTALAAGVAIMGAAFLLLWACDAAQADISQALALAVVALITVLPEYAVEMYFTWMAGQHPDSDYAHYAIANMTGANRLLIGVGWVVIVVIFWVKTRRAVQLHKERLTEVLFLGMATVYAFLIPLKGSLTLIDGAVLLGLYTWYISIASRRPCAECEADGPGELLIRLPALQRRLATAAMFLFAAAAILANAEPFCEGLVTTGKAFGINEFYLVQWLAPLASEAPEFTVAIIFTLRGQAGLALGSLLSAKLNQWTLLVGMIPGVYSISGRTLGPIPMDSLQMQEILLTAAQSLLAMVLLATLRLTVGQGLLLFGLFIGQFIAEPLVAALPGHTLFGLEGQRVHHLFSLFYGIVAVSLIVTNPRRFRGIWQGVKVHPPLELGERQEEEEMASA